MYRLSIIAALMFGVFCGVSYANEEGKFSAVKMKINDVPVSVEWEENESVKALTENLPITVKTHMYGGFEQVGSLGRSLPGNDKRIATKPGDIVLYSGNQIVIFYGSNTWAYTKLGRITGKTQSELEDLLGKSDTLLVEIFTADAKF